MSENDLLGFYEQFAEKKRGAKALSSAMSGVVKSFATDFLGDKKLKKYVKSYLDNLFKADYSEFNEEAMLYESIANSFHTQFDPENKVAGEKLAALYNEYAELKRQKGLIAIAIADMIKACAASMKKGKPEIRTFFNYRYQKETKGESPIDSIDEFQAMIAE